MDNILFGLFVFLILLAGVGIFYYQKMLSILKVNHIEKWNSLGSPTILKNNSINNQKLIMAFLNKKEYLSSNDPKLISLANFLRIYHKIYIAIFIFIFSVFLILILRSN